MVADGNDFETRGRSRTSKAWLIFGCTIWGLFATVLAISVLGLGIGLVQGQVDERFFSVELVMAAFGALAAFRCVVKCLGLYQILSARRDTAS